MEFKTVTSKTVLSTNGYKAKATSRCHNLNMDRSVDEGGEDSAATPVEYLLAAIGGCVSMTLRVFANHKKWDLGEITVNVIQKKKLTVEGVITYVVEEISFEKEISSEQKVKLLAMAEKCPVAQLLKNETKINSKII